MALTPGQVVGDYEIVDLVESSHDGVIYKVRNILLQRFEALRILPKVLQDDSEVVSRFLREAKIHARINHPNIVTFYHAMQLDGVLVMTTEWVDGIPLATYRESGQLELEQTLEYTCQVLSALSHAHSLGFVHRNVTPSNIILTADGTMKLTGFGLAKATADTRMTQPGTVLGSLNYISPEQVKGLSNLDGRSDIYSVGIVLYELVTDRRPFHRKSQFEIMLAHVNDLATAPSLVNPDIPAELSEIILTAISKDPAHRYQTAQEFQARLERLRGGAQPRSEPKRSGRMTSQDINAVTSDLARFDRDEPRMEMSGWKLWAVCIFVFMVAIATFLAVTRH